MKDMKIQRFEQSCFSIEAPEGVIYFDPFGIPAGAKKADLILVSHTHFDHFQKKSIQSIVKKDTELIGPASKEKKLIKWEGIGMKPDDTLQKKGFTIQAIPMYNQAFYRKLFFHPKRKGFIGYVVSRGNTTLYHAGDTDLIPEMGNLEKIDVAFLPIGGTFTMNAREAVQAAGVISPKYIIPMHEKKENLDEFKQNVEKTHENIQVLPMKPQTEITLEDL